MSLTNPNKRKRTSVGANLQPLASTSGRSNTPPDPTIKVKGHKFCYEAFKEVRKAFGIPENVAHSHPFLSTMIMKQVESYHNICKQATTGQGKRAAKAIGTPSINYTTGQYSSTVKKLKDAMIKASKSIDEAYDKGHMEWIGEVQPMVCLWSLFGERYKELRFGTDAKIVGKTSQGNTVLKLTDMGLQCSVKHLFQGLNYSIPVQSGLSQSMGPMTIAVNLAMSNPPYTEKWEKACQRTFSFLRECPYIVDNLSKFGLVENAPMLNALSSVIMITGARQQHRMAFPPCFLMTYLTDKLPEHQLKDGTVVPEGDGCCGHKVAKLDFSGRGAWLAYKTFQDAEYDCPGTDAVLLRQIIYYCMIGTFEDLGILSEITSEKNWKNRQEVNPAIELLKYANKDKTVKVKPVQQLKYSRFQSALLTNLVSNPVEPTNACTAFAGFRSRPFTPQMRQLIEKSGSGIITGRKPNEIANSLSNLADKLYTENKSGYKAGTIKWRKIDKLTATEEGDEVDDVVPETGKTFWNIN